MENPKINPLNTSGAGSRQASRQAQAQTARNAKSNTTAGTQAQASARNIGRSSDFGVVRSPGRLTEGDIIRGEISDLRGNNITVTLENNTILKASIADSSMLSIGQTAAFKLSSVSAGNILLEAMKGSYTQNEITLINKALDEASLPITEHNQNTVKALMDNMLPITKESIQNLMQQSYDYHTDDMNTLALMNRLMMKMDADSVQQFSNYRNGTYQLLGQLKEFSQDIPALLSALAGNGPADSVAAFGEKLLAISLYGDNGQTQDSTPLISQLSSDQMKELMDLLSNTPLTEDTLAQLRNGTLSLHDALTLIRDAINSNTLNLPEGMTQSNLQDKLMLISSTLEAATDSETLRQEVTDSFKNIPVIDTEAIMEAENMEKAQEDDVDNADKQEAQVGQNEGKLGFAGKFLHNLTETARNSINNINNTLNLLQQSGNHDAKPENTNTIIDVISEMYSKSAREHDYLGSFLTQNERNQLLNKLSNMPISKSLLNKIASGEASAKEVVSVIKNIIPLTDSNSVQQLLQSPEFEQIFNRFLQSSWTMTPEQLGKSEQLNSFYNKMNTQLKQFEGLIQTALSGEDSENMQHAAHDMESSIEFMKTLSETFSYMQMPLKLHNQDANADLYVYTQKEKLKRNPDNVHVLLHLSLDHLGDIDIYIDKNKSDVSTRFMLNDQKAIDLIKTNSDVLKSALNSQGYSCQVKVEQADTSTSTVDEFINTKVNTSATSDMKRFSFDIRA